MNSEPIGKRRAPRSPISGSPIRVMPQSKPATTNALEVPAATGGQDVSVMFATLAGMAGLTLLIQALLAYMLLPEGRGAYALCIAFGTLLGLLLTPGAQQGAQYFVAARKMSVSQGVSSALIICFAGGGMAAALAVPLIYSGLDFFQKAETNTFLLSLALVPLTAVSIVLDHQLVALRRFRRLAVFSMLRVAANVLMLLVLVRSLGLGVDGAIIAFAAGHGVMIAAALLYLRRHYALALEIPERSNISRVLTYGLKYHAARLGNALEPHFGVVILGLIASQGEIGLFAAASALMLGFMLISNAVGNALFPRVAGAERVEIVALSLRLVCVGTAIPMLILLALSAPLVRILLSEAFLPAVPLLWIIAPGILAYAASGIFMTHFKGSNRPHICSWAVLLGLCANLSALLILYPTLGAEAAAWGMTIGMTCGCLFLSIVFHKTTRTGLPAVWLPKPSDASFLWDAGRSALSGGIRGRPAARAQLEKEQESR